MPMQASWPFFEKVFEAKNSGSPDRFSSQFSDDLLSYTDTVLGWEFTSHAALKAGLEQFMPNWAGGRAYPTRIMGGPNSAVLSVSDIPELFGDEIHAMAAVDLVDGKVVRWVDYWDSTTFNRDLFDKMAAPDDQYPGDFKAGSLADNAVGSIREIAGKLDAALGRGDGKAAASLFSFSARFEDTSLRTLITGRAAISRYIDRIGADAPYGAGSEVRHVLGGPIGGDYEWVANGASNVRTGITAIELDGQGKISRLTTLYEASRLPQDLRRDFVLRGQEF